MALAACSRSEAALVIGDVEVSRAELREELDGVTANESYVAALEAQLGESVLDDAEGALRRPFVRELLGRRVIFEIIELVTERDGLEPDECALDHAESFAASQVGGDDVLDGFDEPYRSELVQSYAELLHYATHATTGGGLCEEIDTRRDALEAGPEQACVHHIVVSTREDARRVRDELDAGGEFALIAETESIDESAAVGGELGCHEAGTFVAAFEEAIWSAPVGEVVGPVETEYGYHLLLVDSRGVPSLSEAREQITTEVIDAAMAQLVDRLRTVVAEESIEIRVDEEYGTWSAEHLTVVVVGDES